MKKSGIKFKFLFLSALILAQYCMPLSNAEAVFAEGSEEEGEYFTGQISGVDEYTALKLCDGDYMTAYGADVIDITVSSDKNFTAAYIVWNNIPEKYTLTAQNNIIETEDGFLHKLIEFNEPIKEFKLECKTGGELCDIYLLPGGKYPSFVQQWEQLEGRADLLVLSAHADDEYLMFGGTIPYYAKERGLKVQVAYLTTHFEEQPRPHELLNGLWTAGVKYYPAFGVIGDIPGSPIYSLEEAARLYDFNVVLDWFTQQIRRFKPSVIVSHDVNGEYGHGAHMLAAKTVQDAVAISADPNSFPDSAEKYGVWDVPKTYLHFWEENKITMDWEQPLESFGGLTARDAAELAYGKHESQHKWGYIVGYWKKYDIRQFGLYRTLVGTDEKADFMDHIEPVPVREETAPPETAPDERTADEITPATTETAAIGETLLGSFSEVGTETDADNGGGGSGALVIILICVGAAALTGIIVFSVRKAKEK